MKFQERIMQDSKHPNGFIRSTIFPSLLAALLMISGLVARTLSAAEPDRVAILLRETTQKALAEPLRTYISDVEKRFPAKLQVVADDWMTP